MSHQPLPGDHSNSARSGADHHIPNPDATYSADYAPYPKLDANDFAPALDPLLSNPPYSVPTAPPQSPADGTISLFPESNPYVSSAPAPPSATKNPMESVKGVLEKWGKKAADATKKAEGLASDVWQHLKTSPNVADAAVARIAQGTKVLTEGGYEKVFRQAFETSPEEQLKNDSPLSYKVGERTEWSYYKVVIPLHQIRVANPSTSKVNPAEKYIRIITVDNHEFWFMGFVNYESAVKNLQGVSPSP